MKKFLFQRTPIRPQDYGEAAVRVGDRQSHLHFSVFLLCSTVFATSVEAWSCWEHDCWNKGLTFLTKGSYVGFEATAADHFSTLDLREGFPVGVL